MSWKFWAYIVVGIITACLVGRYLYNEDRRKLRDGATIDMTTPIVMAVIAGLFWQFTAVWAFWHFSQDKKP